LLKCIAGKQARVMVVGDVDQCIYEWRGAKPGYIISRFNRDFPRPADYTLSYTFRYGHRLSLAANHLICNNKLRDRKLCLARPENPKTRIFCAKETEPHPIVNLIDHWQESGRPLGEAAVLIRLYAQSIPVELALLEHSIPYRLIGHETVFSCPEIMALLGYLHLCRGSLAQGDPEAARTRITAMLTNPHLWLKQEGIRVLAGNIRQNPQSAGDLIRQLAGDVQSTYLAERMIDLAAVWYEVAGMSPATSAALVLEKVIRETELYDHYRYSSRPASAENKIKTCQAFVRFARRRRLNVSDFLEEIRDLATPAPHDSRKTLLITSIHRAKGLEWPLVILPGLEDGTVPYRTEEDEEGGDHIEDERRLFYVAMTRASEQVCFLYPPDSRLQRRKKTGDSRCPQSTENSDYPASCFLYEANLEFSDQLGKQIEQPDLAAEPLQAADITIGDRYLKAIKTKNTTIRLKRTRPSPESSPAPTSQQPPLTINELAEGLLVEHPLFGPGVVTSADRRKGVVIVHFEEHGSKNLVVKYAGLQPGHDPYPDGVPF
jgi:DNA helicase-2/ATP-dependent DNA helicase PcrA